jgi:hypothetical protein
MVCFDRLLQVLILNGLSRDGYLMIWKADRLVLGEQDSDTSEWE